MFCLWCRVAQFMPEWLVGLFMAFLVLLFGGFVYLAVTAIF